MPTRPRPRGCGTLCTMESRIHVITLAVSDLDCALAFYREGLGLDSAGITGTDFAGDDENPAGDVAMFHLDGDLILALYPRTELVSRAVFVVEVVKWNPGSALRS